LSSTPVVNAIFEFELILQCVSKYTATRLVNKYIHDKWQETWNSQTQNKLYQIYPTIPCYSTLPILYQRKEQIIYNRLRIGHTRLTHSYLIEHTDPPICTNCNQLLSIKHTLTECTSCDQTQHQYYFTDIKKSSVMHPVKIY